MPFEFLSISVPKNYDHALKNFYGDYMVIRKENNNHGEIIFDSAKPYNEYFKEEENK